METFLTIIYVLVCFFLIGVVLLQSGKGGMGALGGGAGGASGTVFGGAGASNFLTKATSVCAALFMILSATLSWFASRGPAALEQAVRNDEARRSAVSGSVDEGTAAEETEAGEMSVPGAGAAEEEAEGAEEAAPADQAEGAGEAAPAEAADEAEPTEAAPSADEAAAE